jgi:V/A-type H+-transporting ATPase subunit D
MPKIKLTKSELKAQRDSLRQFTRFLPTLQLKKQQLQLEMRRIEDGISKIESEIRQFSDVLESWISLFGEKGVNEKLASAIKVEKVNTSTHNIAGVEVPVFESIDFTVQPYDLFREDSWIDDAVAAIKKMIGIKLRREIAKEQLNRVGMELRTTSQRVNLFEKVKIPETRENIRVIQIYLGDQDTAGVARAKIAKAKMPGAA